MDGREPTEKELEKIANITFLNLWHMDGIKGSMPFKQGLRCILYSWITNSLSGFWIQVIEDSLFMLFDCYIEIFIHIF